MNQNSFQEKITAEQETLFITYHKKWFDLEYATGPTDLYKIEAAINLAYQALGKQRPNIIVYESPYQAIRELDQWVNLPMIPLMSLGWQLRSQLPRAGQMGVRRTQREVHPEGPLGTQLRFALIRQLGEQIANAITTSAWFGYASWFDFCIAVLNCSCNFQAWEALRSIVQCCSFIIPFEVTCLVIDRPTNYLLDGLERFHAECKPAVTYADDFGLYFYHGIGLPEEYGQLPTQEWKAEWLFQASDPQVRRALLHGIGYEKIAEALPVIEIDSFKEYSLLKLENHGDIPIPLPILLLKRINPDNSKIDIIEAPLHSQTVQEALAWVNSYWFIETKDYR